MFFDSTMITTGRSFAGYRYQVGSRRITGDVGGVILLDVVELF